MTTTSTSAADGEADQPFIPQIDLDRDSADPLYRQISQPLEELILSGALKAGRLIEDEVSMAQRLSVSRPTARRALQDLVARGLLTRRRGAGTRVTPSHVRRSLSLTSLNDDLVKSGFKPHTQVMSYQVRLANDEEAALLHCEEGHEIVRIERLRLIDERPLAFMSNLLRADIAPSLTQLSQFGLYACLDERGLRPVAAEQAIGARSANDADASRLAISAGAALLTMQRTAYDAREQVIEYGSHVYNAALYSFQFNLTAN
ncbi:GntR family transcriptional regulator [Acidipropionibacterium jensenii]|uniref:GntR family transcriptional regulator n=1 Tax=Acidipropionibacterium jensenii TaxID=1749 RepID=UPI00110BAF67|nr:GntR family transcriptional regulator [Acidipropionibacterium jensenii]QCV87750.1 GntR family transcriptional regulator [Acidipropionibacterium jensenii]